MLPSFSWENLRVFLMEARRASVVCTNGTQAAYLAGVFVPSGSFTSGSCAFIDPYSTTWLTFTAMPPYHPFNLLPTLS